MASIRENKKNGKVVSYRFIASLGRDINGKQIRKYATWTADADLSPAKAKKAALRAAEDWEREISAEYQKEEKARAQGKVYSLPPEKRRDDFVTFVNNIWLPLQVQNGSNKPATVQFYRENVKYIAKYFKGAVLQDISPMEIQKYLVYLRTDYKSKYGKPLSAKSTHHIYATLNLIFSYAEKQEMILKNPMLRVDAPKKVKRPVDAMTEEQAKAFFELLPILPLDFHARLVRLYNSPHWLTGRAPCEYLLIFPHGSNL